MYNMKKIFIILMICFINLNIACFADSAYQNAIKDGDKAFDRKDYKTSLVYYNKAIEMEPKKPDAYINRSITYAFQNEDDKAIEDLNKAIKYDHKNQYAYNNRALQYLKTGKYRKGIRDFSKAIKINPKEAEYYANRALCYMYSGKTAAAIKDIEKALSIDNKNEVVVMNFACIVELKHLYKEAASIYSFVAHQYSNGDAENYMRRCHEKIVLQEIGYPDILVDYVYEISHQIRANWQPPKSKKSYLAIAEATVDKNGSLTNIQIIKSSDIKEADNSIISAINQSAPLNKLPKEIKKQNVTVIIPFGYRCKKIKR